MSNRQDATALSALCRVAAVQMTSGADTDANLRAAGLAQLRVLRARVDVELEEAHPVAEDLPVLLVRAGQVCVHSVKMKGLVDVLGLVRVNWVGGRDAIEMHGSVRQPAVRPVRRRGGRR